MNVRVVLVAARRTAAEAEMHEAAEMLEAVAADRAEVPL